MFPYDLLVILLIGLSMLVLGLKYRKALQRINYHPGLRSIQSTRSGVPNLWGFSPEKTVTWLTKHEIFQHYGWDIISSVSAWPTASVTFFVADPIAIKEITAHRERFPKLMTDYSILSLWPQHRGIGRSAMEEISTTSFASLLSIWEETFRVIQGIDEMWGDLESVPIKNVVGLTFEISLEVISITGFGVPLSKTIPLGHKMSFGDALHCVARDGFIKLAVPDIIPGFTERIRKLRVALPEMRQYMEELIVANKTNGNTSLKEDSLFSNLIEATGKGLTSDELYGKDIFFAGHETTTHTLSFAFLLLAAHPDEQELLYQHITDNPAKPWSSKARLTRVLAVLNETMRMFPPVTGLQKYNVDACSLRACSSSSIHTYRDVKIPRGATVVIDVPGLHYNDKYWPEPYLFKPDRFLGPWDENAFQPFSTGSRACMGRSFFEAEGIATLTSFVSKYKIEFYPGYEDMDLSLIMQKISDVVPGLTLCPKPMPLLFKKRS
ncbi:cytochrome P450 [Ramaria rubella]|nr:cytochrome P450 [Ramaria rubella]